MKILKFHIVGLTHNDVKNCEVQYAKEAVGKTLCLVPDDANPFDLLAVKAYEGQKSIGFVSALEVEDVRAAIIASGDSSLRTRCVACDSKEENGKTGLYLEVKALVDATDEEIEQARIKIYDDRMYEDWHYTGPIYTIDKLVRFSDSTLMLEGVIDRIIKIQKQLAGKDAGENGQAGEMMAMLQEELDEDLKEARERLVAFLENQRSDYSREMTQARNRLLKKLGQIKDDELQKLRAVLLTEMGFITSSKYRESAAKSFFIDTPMAIKGKPNGAYDYEDQIDEIECQLGAFPFNLYRMFKADPVDFLRQVFYKRVPRKMMIPSSLSTALRTCSGAAWIALCWSTRAASWPTCAPTSCCPAHCWQKTASVSRFTSRPCGMRALTSRPPSTPHTLTPSCWMTLIPRSCAPGSAPSRCPRPSLPRPRCWRSRVCPSATARTSTPCPT